MVIDVSKIMGVSLDSRNVKKGHLFAALSGSRSNGVEYIDAAIRNGAAYILAPTGTPKPQGAELIESDNPRRDLALIAAAFYKKQPAHIVAVTGTNGKTSIVHFTQQLWQAQNLKAASLGTLGRCADGVCIGGNMTTPDTVTLMAQLADLAAAGITHLAMEASSHGLDQYRLDGVKLEAAAFTNLSHDHLDYHSDMQDYFTAKSRLFSEVLPADGVAVLNADDLHFEQLKQIADQRGQKLISYGFAGEDLKIIKADALPYGQHLTLDIYGARIEIDLPLVGAFQALNALAAFALAGGEIKALEKLKGAPGRLQHVGHGVYVDYAHTPNALEEVLKALRPHTQGQLICVMGCGGDRDAAKRPVMGRIASELADVVIVTDDNPRSEDPATIRAEILATAKDAQDIPDRAQAIRTAIANKQDGDVVVIAGKGHEQGQIFADHTDPFNDTEEAQKAIKELF